MLIEITTKIIEILATVFELIGALVIIFGGIQATIYLVIEEFKKSSSQEKEKVRYILGTKIIIGVEFFVVGDMLDTVITPSFEAIAKLAALVAIRTALSYFLHWEIQRKKHFVD